MAEYRLKVGGPGRDDDGDVLGVFSRLRIRCVHAQHICFPKSGDGRNRQWNLLNGAGLLDLDTVAQDYEEATRDGKLERLAHDRCRLTVLATQESVEIVSNTDFLNPYNGKINQMDVAVYFNQKCKTLASPGGRGQPVFGERGKEVLYGGRTTMTHAVFDVIWNAIETETPKRESDYQLWPIGTEEIKVFLFIPVEDFTEEQGQRIIVPLFLLDGNGEIVWQKFDRNDVVVTASGVDGEPPDDSGDWSKVVDKSHRYQVDWASASNLAAMNVAESDVRNRELAIDIRAATTPFFERDVLHDKRTGSLVAGRV